MNRTGTASSHADHRSPGSGSGSGGHRRRAQRGFSMVELGIVMVVLVVLLTLVLMGRGYVQAARHRSAVELVQALRSSGHQWAQRYRNGVDFSGLNLTPANWTTSTQPAPGFSQPPRTPWGGAVRSFQAFGTGTNCTGNTCMRIQLEMPAINPECQDLRQMIPRAVSTQCDSSCGGGPCLTIVAR